MPKVGADTDLIRSAELEGSRTKVEQANAKLENALRTNWPPGEQHCSMDREVVKEMGQPIELLRVLVKAFGSLSNVDSRSVDNLQKVLRDAEDMTEKLARSVDTKNVPNRT
ncbi:hypothetical protein EV382_2650 [Micromonospora violae]|uniref:Uncharacterized protein n=1 Tax=Micromonospora violae TaxID=1278207 RepID=A0A4Q7UGU3_9ACTN|nr:hypothetical protein [Micromonospora violae]RZT79451.1 hypothetical protein EV382_2650 [Micromonospora violae]